MGSFHGTRVNGLNQASTLRGTVEDGSSRSTRKAYKTATVAMTVEAVASI
jgi:hypothetical protein